MPQRLARTWRWCLQNAIAAHPKEKFGSEKNDLSEQLNSYSAELMKAKEEAETNLNEVEQFAKSRMKDLDQFSQQVGLNYSGSS